MSMEANISTDTHGNFTIHMKGGLSYDNIKQLQDEISIMNNKCPHSRVTLDMDGVDFVGSTGISHFVQTLNILNSRKKDIKLSNVKSEFMKVFKLYSLSAMETLILKFEDDTTEDLSQEFANRSRTFEN